MENPLLRGVAKAQPQTGCVNLMDNKKLIKYNPKLKNLAKHLRNNSTLSEVLLWNELKRKKLGYDFHRQKPIDKYIVDFYCADLSLVIEIDGESHTYKGTKDKIRQKYLEDIGLRIIRIYDNDIKKNINGVLLYINDCIKQYK